MGTRYVWNKYYYTNGEDKVIESYDPNGISILPFGSLTLCSERPEKNSSGYYTPNGNTFIINSYQFTKSDGYTGVGLCDYPYAVRSSSNYYFITGYTSCSAGSPALRTYYSSAEAGDKANLLLADYLGTDVEGSNTVTLIVSGKYASEIIKGSQVGTVSSTNRNEYPDNGVFGEYYYEYKGEETDEGGGDGGGEITPAERYVWEKFSSDSEWNDPFNHNNTSNPISSVDLYDITDKGTAFIEAASSYTFNKETGKYTLTNPVSMGMVSDSTAYQSGIMIMNSGVSTVTKKNQYMVSKDGKTLYYVNIDYLQNSHGVNTSWANPGDSLWWGVESSKIYVYWYDDSNSHPEISGRITTVPFFKFTASDVSGGTGTATSYVSSDNSSAYPYDGTQDGVRYKFKLQDNPSPTSIEYNTENVRPGYSTRIVITKSSDIKLDEKDATISYVYQVQRNGGAWETISESERTSYTYNIPEGTTTLQFRVYAKDSAGWIGDYVTGEAIDLIKSFTITVVASPENGGTVSGGGTFEENTSASVTASPNIGYEFSHWEDSGTQVSTNHTYSFLVTSNKTLTAVFTKIKFTISVSMSPADSGEITGAGIYEYGSTVNLLAETYVGFNFVGWEENDALIGTSANLSFEALANRTLTAVYEDDFKIWVGVNDVARKVRKIYVGVDNVARRVSMGYAGIEAVCRRLKDLSRLPFGYTEVEYLLNSANADGARPVMSAMDRFGNISMNNLAAPNRRVEFCVKIPESFGFSLYGSQVSCNYRYEGNYGTEVRAHTSSQRISFSSTNFIYFDTTSFGQSTGGYSYGGPQGPINEKFICGTKSNSTKLMLYVNDELITTNADIKTTTLYSWCLFGQTYGYSNSTTHSCTLSGKPQAVSKSIYLYSYKVYDTSTTPETLLDEFVPCINPDGVAGLISMATGQFKASYDANIPFTSGPIVRLKKPIQS